MKTGFNLLIWTTNVSEEHFGHLEKLKEVGYDGVEVPIFEGDAAHYQKLAQVLKDNGLKCTSVTVIADEECNPISANPKHREGAVDYLKGIIDRSALLGSETLCGPFHSPLGVFSGTGATDDEKKYGAEVHHEIAEYGKQAGLKFALEYLNRFECYFLNTMEDAVNYVKMVDHPNFGTMYDTFHANIEEKDPIGCIAPAFEFINHVHISENDRGTPGKGHIDFPGTLKKLHECGWDGWLTIESFGRALPDLAAATRVWRDFFPSLEYVYTEGLKYVKEQWELMIKR